MANQQPDDSMLGTAGSGDGAPDPVKLAPVRPDNEQGVAGAPHPDTGSSPPDRPGSNPKNPGDFGHR